MRCCLIVALCLCPVVAWGEFVQDVYQYENLPAEPQLVQAGFWLVRGLGDDSQPTNENTPYIIWGNGSAHTSQIPDNPPFSEPPPHTPGGGSAGSDVYLTSTEPGVGYARIGDLQAVYGPLSGGEVIDDFSIYVSKNEPGGDGAPILINNIEVALVNHETGLPYITYSMDSFGDRGVRLMDGGSGSNASDFELFVPGGLHLALLENRPDDIVVFRLQMSELASGSEFLWAANPRKIIGEFDMGDAPTSYTTLQDDGGPVHGFGEFEWLGPNTWVTPPDPTDPKTNLSWDKETDPDLQPNIYDGTDPSIPVSDRASADDIHGFDDEDGVEIGVKDGQNGAFVTVSVGDSTDTLRYGADDAEAELFERVYLDGWVDNNNDGDFEDEGEHVYGYGVNPLDPDEGSFDVTSAAWLADANPDPNQHELFVPLPGFEPRWEGTYLRWRVAYSQPTSYAGWAFFGEVEDYVVTPEPASALLLGVPLAVLARHRRRRKKK
ncbi:GEVED domain-containing protein [Planctomycetota bacterium]